MLTRLLLRDFRCFEAVALEPGTGANFLVGANAQGKTSVLEAVCVLLRLQSPRARTMGELTRHGANGWQVRGTLLECELQCAVQSRRRRLEINGGEPESTAEYLANGRVVWFGNRDLELISGRGEGRRRYLDFLGQQLDPEYRKAWRQYKQAMSSRNALLKENNTHAREQNAVYESILTRHGAYLRQVRIAMVERLIPAIDAAHKAIGQGREKLQLHYAAPGDEAALAEALAAARERDFRMGQTSAGPHRDDLDLLVDERPAARYASEGQQRTIALALKCGQERLLSQLPGAPPLLLIDDIFGELDLDRRRALLRFLPDDLQMWITATHLDWAEGFPDGSRHWEVSGHQVTPIAS